MQKYIALCLVLAQALLYQIFGDANVIARADATKPSSHSLQGLSFLQGKWHGKSKAGAYVEEYWSGVEGDSMIGHCRMIKEGKTTFYELLAIVNTPTGIVLRMRHFDGAMSPWKEQDEAGDCLLVNSSGKEVVFGNSKSGHALKVTYRKASPRSLYALVEDTKNGKTTSYPFEYKQGD